MAQIGLEGGNGSEHPLSISPIIFKGLFCVLYSSLPSADGNTETDSTTTDHEDVSQDVVILIEHDQELQLNQHPEEVELNAQSVVESFPFYLSSSTEEYLVQDTTESPPNSPSAVELLQTLKETSAPTEIRDDSQHLTVLKTTNTTVSNTGPTNVDDSLQNTSLLPSIYNNTHSHNILNFTFWESVPQSTTGFVESTYEPDTQNQMSTQRNPKGTAETTDRPNEIQNSNLNFSRLQDYYRETDNNRSQENSLWAVTLRTLDPAVAGKVVEATVQDTVQMFLSTQASSKEVELVTQPAQTTTSSIKDQTSMWAPLDGSGDNSQGTLQRK